MSMADLEMNAAPPGPDGTGAPCPVAQMREHLRVARPTSGPDALRILRAAFPETRLADRVRAAEAAASGFA